MLKGVATEPPPSSFPSTTAKSAAFGDVMLCQMKRSAKALADGLILDVPPASDLGFKHLTGVGDQLEKISF